MHFDLAFGLGFPLSKLTQAVRWVLNLNGTNYMKLSEPWTASGDWLVEIEFTLTDTGLVSKVLYGDELWNSSLGWLVDVSNSVVRFRTPSGISLSGVINVADGNLHTVKIQYISGVLDFYVDNIFEKTHTFTITDSGIPAIIGARHGNDGVGAVDEFIGTIYSVKITDLTTPANSVEWDINSGPETGTVYQLPVGEVLGSDIWTNGEQVLADLALSPTETIVSGNPYVVDNIPVGIQVDYGGGFVVPDNNPFFIIVASGVTIQFRNNSGGSLTFTPQVKEAPEALIMQNVTPEDWEEV